MTTAGQRRGNGSTRQLTSTHRQSEAKLGKYSIDLVPNRDMPLTIDLVCTAVRANHITSMYGRLEEPPAPLQLFALGWKSKEPLVVDPARANATALLSERDFGAYLERARVGKRNVLGILVQMAASVTEGARRVSGGGSVGQGWATVDAGQEAANRRPAGQSAAAYAGFDAAVGSGGAPNKDAIILSVTLTWTYHFDHSPSTRQAAVLHVVGKVWQLPAADKRMRLLRGLQTSPHLFFLIEAIELAQLPAHLKPTPKGKQAAPCACVRAGVGACLR
jgi:hypothetical protein